MGKNAQGGNQDKKDKKGKKGEKGKDNKKADMADEAAQDVLPLEDANNEIQNT